MPQIKKIGVERAKTQSCGSWSDNQFTAYRMRIIINSSQLRSTVESLVMHINWIQVIPWPNHTEYLPLLPGFQNITHSSSQSQFATLVCSKKKVLLVDPSVQFDLLSISQPNPTPISRGDLGKQPLNLLCTCKGSYSLCFLSCCEWNCPAIKTKTPENIHRLWYLKIQNKFTVQLHLILLQSR